MPSVRSALPVAAVLAAALTLGGCGGTSSTSSGADPLAKVTVSGTDAKKAPSVSLGKTPLSVTKTSSRVVTEGTGATVTQTDLVSINALIIDGTSGKVATSTWESSPVGLDLGAATLFASLKTQLPGKKIGSRVLVASPPADAFGTQGNTTLGIGGTDTVVFLVDILSTTKPLSVAGGTAVAPKKGLPVVTFTDGKAATITMPKGAKPPTKLVVQPLITGSGDKVAAGRTVRVTYTGALWKNGKVFDASADHSDQKYFEFAVGQGQVIPGWDKGVIGQPVGSRLLLVVPPAQGYGMAGNPPTISGTDTLVFVVDILAAY